jgi:hypothetical protein
VQATLMIVALVLTPVIVVLSNGGVQPSLALIEQVDPARLQWIGAGGAIAPDRVQPSGSVWTSIQWPVTLHRDDAPTVLSRIGLHWSSRLPTGSPMFPGDTRGMSVRLCGGRAVPSSARGALPALRLRPAQLAWPVSGMR